MCMMDFTTKILGTQIFSHFVIILYGDPFGINTWKL